MELINKLRARAMLVLMSKGRNLESVSIPEIPENWKQFPNSNDLWKRVVFPKDQDTSACLYQGYSGSVFLPHIHELNIEHFVILNKGGKVEVITDEEIRIVEYPNAVVFEKGVPHAVKFLKDTKILVMWHPSMVNGWEAQFIDDQKINTTSAL